MNTYVVFSRKEVLNEQIEHVGHKFEANNLIEASAKVKKFVRFEKIKEFLIVCYDDWSRDPDIGKLRLTPKYNRDRRIRVRIKD